MKVVKNIYDDSKTEKQMMKDIIKKIDGLVGDEYRFIIEGPPNRSSKVVLLHNKCNKKYVVKMSEFMKGNRYRCNCNREKGGNNEKGEN